MELLTVYTSKQTWLYQLIPTLPKTALKPQELTLHAGILEQMRTALNNNSNKKKNRPSMQSSWDNRRCLFKMLQSPHWLQQEQHLTWRRAFPGSCKVCGVPDQPDKLKEAIISHYRGWNVCWRCCQCDHYILPCPRRFKISPLKAQCDALLLWCQNPELYSGGLGLCRKSSTLLTRYGWGKSVLENSSYPGIQVWFLLRNHL